MNPLKYIDDAHKTSCEKVQYGDTQMITLLIVQLSKECNQEVHYYATVEETNDYMKPVSHTS